MQLGYSFDNGLIGLIVAIAINEYWRGGLKMSEEAMLLREIKQAQQDFNEADQDHINKAIYDLMYAEMRYNQYVNERRKEIERNIKECSKLF